MISTLNILVIIIFPLIQISSTQNIYKPEDKGNGPITPEGCQEEGTYFPNYEICGVYHKCELKGKNTWTLKTLYCPAGQSFVEEFQSCERIPCEAREPWPVAPAYFACDQYSQYRKFQVPGDCHLYYVCIFAGSHFTYKIGKCVGGFFNEKKQKCEYSRLCPQTIEYAPPCGGGYIIELFSHPKICTKYYLCHPCYDSRGKKDTCVIDMECPRGLVYQSGLDKNYCVPGVCGVELVYYNW